ncbi:hypothetical protein ANCCEY_15137, partial [Ancylostoma ceylanicum]
RHAKTRSLGCRDIQAADGEDTKESWFVMAEAGSNFEGFIIESGDEEEEVDIQDEGEDQYRLVAPVEEDSSDEEEFEFEDAGDGWFHDIAIQNRFRFDDVHGVSYHVQNNCKEPIDFYKLFLNDETLSLIVRETNRYGCSKYTDWVPTDKEEISKLIALTLQMGIVRLPSLRSYWSSDPIYGCNRIGSNVMPRSRFEKLMTSLHLCDNSASDGTDRLYKISEFLRLFNKACQDSFRPGKEGDKHRSKSPPLLPKKPSWL